MNSPQLLDLPVMFPSLGNMLLLEARSFCLNLENFFLSLLFTSLIFIVNKFDNKYWKARIFYQIYWQADIFYITFLFPYTSHLAFGTSNIGSFSLLKSILFLHVLLIQYPNKIWPIESIFSIFVPNFLLQLKTINIFFCVPAVIICVSH